MPLSAHTHNTHAMHLKRTGARDTLLGAKNAKVSANLLSYAAISKDHVPSQAILGRMYAKGEEPFKRNTVQALYWFQKAGGQGEHASLYNAGLILTEGMSSEDIEDVEAGRRKREDYIQADLVGGLAYFHTAARLHLQYSDTAHESLTMLSKEAHAVVAESAAYADLTIVQVADVFMFGSLEDVEDEVGAKWRRAVEHLTAFNSSFVASAGQTQDAAAMRAGAAALIALVEEDASVLSDMQMFLSLDYLNDMLGPLAALDDSYVRVCMPNYLKRNYNFYYNLTWKYFRPES